MSAESDRIVRYILEAEVGLDEGTIIILNGGEGHDQLLNNVNKSNPGNGGSQFTMDRKGRKWNFDVKRNEFGQITNIEVQEV